MILALDTLRACSMSRSIRPGRSCWSGTMLDPPGELPGHGRRWYGPGVGGDLLDPADGALHGHVPLRCRRGITDAIGQVEAESQGVGALLEDAKVQAGSLDIEGTPELALDCLPGACR